MEITVAVAVTIEFLHKETMTGGGFHLMPELLYTMEVNKNKHSPLNKGFMLNTAIHPELENCPNVVSK